MIDFQDVSKNFGGQTVLSDVSFRVNSGEHVGIVGPNGAGKTTLFNLITGEAHADTGNIALPKDCRIGYVRQHVDPSAVSLNLLEYAETALPELEEMQMQIHTLDDQARAVEGSRRDGILRRIGDLQTRFESMGGYNIRNRAEQALSGLGFAVESFTRPFPEFSGGWQSRAALARVLVAEPDVLLLDEPSNYLDNPTIEWLQKYLRDFRGTLLLISHDRYLLNSLTSVTMEVANGRVERYAGNYDLYARERELREQQRLAAQKNQDRKRAQVERFIERFRAKNTKAVQVQSRIKQLERMEKVETLDRIVSRGRIRLAKPPHCGVEVVRLDGAGLTYDGDRWVLRGVDLRITRGEKLALVGYNGQGKTTLLRMLAGKLPLSEGKRVVGAGVRVGYQSQDFTDTMDSGATVFDTVKSVGWDIPEERVRSLLGGFGFSGVSVEKRVGVLSGGEKIRLALARLLVKPPNLLVLDEPTTHLDIQARERLEEALRDYEGTMCIVSHDIEFLRHVAAEIVAMAPPGIVRYPGGYDHYREKAEQAGERDTRIGAVAKQAVSEERSTPDKKELRRGRAQQRQAIHARTKDLKKLIRRIEQQIEVYEKERAAIIEILAHPDQIKDFAETNRRLKTIESEIAEYTRRWEDASMDLEDVEA